MTSTSITPHPNWLLFALAIGGFAIGTTEFATMSLLPQMAEDLNIGKAVAGHVISAYALGVVLGAPMIAMLAARFSHRALLLGLMAFFSVMHWVSFWAPSYSSLLLLRLLSGLPHGAYFGVGALVAASLVPSHRRASAVGLMMSGLTVATTLGVLLLNQLTQIFSWRSVFVVVGLLSIACALLIAWFLPPPKTSTLPAGSLVTSTLPVTKSSIWREFRALKNPRMWLLLGIGAIGFGGTFAIYTYLSLTLQNVSHLSVGAASLVLALFGVGMTLGNLIIPRLAGNRPFFAVPWLLLSSAFFMLLYPFSLGNIVSVSLVVLLIGTGAALGTLLQVCLMNEANDAQTLAAALNHSAFNAANALGPFLGGLAINAGFGLPSTGIVGSLLALGGLSIWLIAYFSQHRPSRAGLTTDKPV